MEVPHTNSTSFNTDSSLLMTNQLLLKEIEKGSSFVSSPLSFHLTLSLVAAGSTGKTLEQLLSFLGSEYLELNQLHRILPGLRCLPRKKKLERNVPEHQIQHCCSLVVVGSINPDEAREEVSLWAERKTRGLIKEVLPPGSVDNDAALILATTIYFKVAWDQKFDASRAQLGDFHLLNGQIVQSFEAHKVLKLPYQTGLGTRQFSMHFFLPDKKDGLSNLVKMINSKPGFFNQQFNLWKVELSCSW
ncbi:PREDICTED: serpin-ZXA-like [Populus euphratica]|uniref:Serpin-ZXA-like n=1 Tax=Populus euphratica TaxID=75702 RepID=A0AAJ6SVI6_POPEU|nr:PREDICTED: serpin-ZXA-like [Populus euphratica]